MSRYDARTVVAIERRRKAISLRRQGLSYQAIANELGMAKSSVHSAIGKAMQTLEKDIAEEANLMVTLELERLDCLQLALWDKAMEGHLGAVSKVLKIMERRARLLGLDAPAKVALKRSDCADPCSGTMAMSPEERSARIAELEKKRAAENSVGFDDQS